MSKTKRILAFALAVVLVLTGCKSTLTSIAHKVLGTSNEVQEDDTTQWAVLSSLSPGVLGLRLYPLLRQHPLCL